MANDYFNKIKSKAQENFKRVLSANTISDDDFTSAVGQLSLIAAAELGEYILYRGSIIKALDEAIIDVTKKESLEYRVKRAKVKENSQKRALREYFYEEAIV